MNKLHEGGVICENCGNTIYSEDAFCVRCRTRPKNKNPSAFGVSVCSECGRGGANKGSCEYCQGLGIYGVVENGQIFTNEDAYVRYGADLLRRINGTPNAEIVIRGSSVSGLPNSVPSLLTIEKLSKFKSFLNALGAPIPKKFSTGGYVSKPDLASGGAMGNPKETYSPYDGFTPDECKKINKAISDSKTPEDSEKDPDGLTADDMGAKFDAGKIRVALLKRFGLALLAVADLATGGADKYVAHGWAEVDNAVERYDDAEFGHYLREMFEERDPDMNVYHVVSTVFNGLARLQKMIEANPEWKEQLMARKATKRNV